MTDTTTNPFDLAHLVVLHRDDRDGYQPMCSCGWHGPWNDYLTAADAGGEHRDGAVGPPDDLDRAMTELLDLQDDLAEAVVWLAENWSADLPGPYVRTATHYASDNDRQGKAGVRLLVPCDNDDLDRAAFRLGTPVIDDPANDDDGDIRYRRATRAIGRVHIQAYARMEDLGPMSPVPFYDDGQVTLYCADLRAIDLPAASVAAVVTSPPYNVGLDYGHTSDALPWPGYWAFAADAAALMARTLVDGGRAWVNTAVSVPDAPHVGGPHSGRSGKARVMLAHRWASVIEAAGLDLVDQVAWCSRRGSGTAWGSWESPAAPNLRGDWESILIAAAGGWEREAPDGMEDWRDTVGGWPVLCSTVWNLRPGDRGGHPAPFPIELARRAVRLSTWPGETVLDPFAGSGTSLLAARQLGRRAIGIEASERYCALAVSRLAQTSLDFQGAA